LNLERLFSEINKINKKLDELEMTQKQNYVYNADEVAGYLRISKNKVYELWKTGELKYVSIGTRKISTLKQIKNFITANTNCEETFNNNIKII